LTGGSTSRRAGQLGVDATLRFQARAKRRRNAASAGLPTLARYATKCSTTPSSTVFGAKPFAEQNRISDESRARISGSGIPARSSSQHGNNGAPCSGTPFSRPSHSRAAFTLLLWFDSVFGVSPAGTSCSWPRSARTAL